MDVLSNLAFRRPRLDASLLFLLGLFSTWQIIQVAGVAVSTLLTLLTAGYLVLTRSPDFKKNWLLLGLLISFTITTVLSIFVDIPSGYKKKAILSYVQWILIFLVCLYCSKDKSNHCRFGFFKGFLWSCYAQAAWCLLQILFYKGLSIDLNQLVFAKILGFQGEYSQYRNGSLVCTGLHWHAANMIPILVFLYFYHHNILMKGLCILLVYFTKNATAMIGIFLCIGLDCLCFVKRTLVDRYGALKLRTLIFIVLGVFAVLLLAPVLWPKLREVIDYLWLRVYQIANPSLGNESSAVHFNYYRLLPRILSNISLPEVFFGSGIDTSGYRFTQFEGQYPDMIWTVESDFVNQIFSCGIIGLFLHYGLLIALIRKLLQKKQSCFVCVLLILIACGFIYNNQLLWVQLVELMLYIQFRHGNSSLPSCTVFTQAFIKEKETDHAPTSNNNNRSGL